MTENFFKFADTTTICEISGKICDNLGLCGDCPTSYYVMFFDEEKLKRIFEEMGLTNYMKRKNQEDQYTMDKTIK